VALPPIELAARPEFVDKVDDQSITHQQHAFIRQSFVDSRCERRQSQSSRVPARLMIM
jgi:hypothetical protein